VERVVRCATHRLIAAAAVLAVAAQSSAAQESTIRRTVISLPGHAAPILLDTIGILREVNGSPARAYAALALAYQQLRIPVGIEDESRRYIGNLHFTRMRNLGGAALSQLIDCGAGMTGPRADQYRVHFAIVSRIDSLGAGLSRLRSTVVAGAEDVQGSSKDPVKCGSSGRLEARISELVTLHLRSAPP
jgi:hypothetical protein